MACLGDALGADLGQRLGGELVQHGLGARGLGDGPLVLALAQAPHLGQPHAIGREHAGIGMDEDRLHPQRVGDGAGVLPARAAEAVERVARHVIAALDRDLLDGVRHVLDGDAQVTLGDLLAAQPRLAGGGGDRLGHLVELPGDDLRVERLVGVGAEDGREVLRLQLAQHDVGVRDRQRPAAAIAGGAGVRPGAVGADLEAAVAEMQDRAAAGRDRVDVHHRRAHPHARHLGLEAALVLAGEVADIGAGAAHVEADQPVMARELAGLDHADDTAGGAGEDGILALEEARIGQAAVRLHEHQAGGAGGRAPSPTLPHKGQGRSGAPGFGVVPGAIGGQRRVGRGGAQLVGDLVHIAAQDGREIGVDHGGVAAADQLHQRRHLVADADLAEAHLGRDRGDARLVVGVLVAVHEGDGDGVDAVGPGRLERPACCSLVERRHHLACRVEPLGHLGHPFIEQLWQDDVQVEEPRPVLVADAQQVAEALRDQQQRPVALALEQRIGRNRRAHLDRVDGVRRDRLAGLEPQQVADALHGGVAIVLGLGEQLVRDDAPSGRRPTMSVKVPPRSTQNCHISPSLAAPRAPG